MFEFSFEAMGTGLEVRVLDQVAPILQEKVKTEIFDFTVWYDETFSRFKEDSLVTKISNSPGIYTVPTMLTEILKIYQKFNTLTDGAMNPLIGNTISDLGYDSKYTLRKKDEVRSTPKFLDAIEIVSEDKIKVNDKVLIDIGAIGKGFWVDEVRKIVERNKISHYIINGSGDIFYSSPNSSPLKVFLENPDKDGEYLGEVSILNESVCGSGINKRNWSVNSDDNLHHVVNANSSLPTEGILAVWVKANTTTIADGLATALFFVTPESLQKDFNFEYYILLQNKKVLSSKNFFAFI